MQSPDGDAEATEQLRTITRVITESPALLARERQVFARYAESLAALIAEETGAPPNSVEPGRGRRSAAGSPPRADRLRAAADARRRGAAAIGRGVRAEAKRAFELLREGLGDYARRPGAAHLRPGTRHTSESCPAQQPS